MLPGTARRHRTGEGFLDVHGVETPPCCTLVASPGLSLALHFPCDFPRQHFPVSPSRRWETSCSWASRHCQPTACQPPPHLPASCFKLPPAFCCCSSTGSTTDTKKPAGVCAEDPQQMGGPAQFRATATNLTRKKGEGCDGYLALLLLNMYSDPVFFFFFNPCVDVVHFRLQFLFTARIPQKTHGGRWSQRRRMELNTRCTQPSKMLF